MAAITLHVLGDLFMSSVIAAADSAWTVVKFAPEG